MQKFTKKNTSAVLLTAFPSSVFPKAAMTVKIKQCMENVPFIAALFIKLPYESEALNWLHNRSLDPKQFHWNANLLGPGAEIKMPSWRGEGGANFFLAQKIMPYRI